MTKLTTILTALIALSAIHGFANETEDKIQITLETRITNLERALDKFMDFKTAYARKESSQREAVLRKLCRRMKNETQSIDTAIDAMDTYLRLQSFTREDAEELKRTKGNISQLKDEIEELKRGLGKVETKSREVVSQ